MSRKPWKVSVEYLKHIRKEDEFSCRFMIYNQQCHTPNKYPQQFNRRVSVQLVRIVLTWWRRIHYATLESAMNVEFWREVNVRNGDRNLGCSWYVIKNYARETTPGEGNHMSRYPRVEEQSEIAYTENGWNQPKSLTPSVVVYRKLNICYSRQLGRLSYNQQ